jgi:hypothetical protein
MERSPERWKTAYKDNFRLFITPALKNLAMAKMKFTQSESN